MVLTLSALLLSACARADEVVVDTDALLARLPALTARRFAASLSDERLAGQLIIAGLEGRQDGRSRPLVDDEMRVLLDRVQPGGVVLFAESFVSPGQMRSLVSGIHSRLSIPALIATDHEGGLVSRLDPDGALAATPVPPAAMLETAVASGGTDNLARSLGRVIGSELRAVGVTMNLAPVVDVNPPGAVGAIGRHGRTYSDDPGRAGELAALVAAGMQDAGVAATLKHFPGHGGVLEDSHYEPGILDVGLEEWRARELKAFAAASLGHPAAIMTAHITLPAITGSSLPATISQPIVSAAREVVGPDALIMTDALNMRAIRTHGTEAEIAVYALAAGHDLLLKPLDPLEVRDAIVRELATGRLDRERLEDSVRRILGWKQRVGLLGPAWLLDPTLLVPDPGTMEAVLGNAEHLGIVAAIRAASEEER